MALGCYHRLLKLTETPSGHWALRLRGYHHPSTCTAAVAAANAVDSEGERAAHERLAVALVNAWMLRREAR